MNQYHINWEAIGDFMRPLVLFFGVIFVGILVFDILDLFED